MKLGIVSAIFDELEFEEMIESVHDLGYSCVEVACWPKGESERRYAGVCHIDVDNLDDDNIKEIKDICLKNEVEISSLAFYPNNLDGDLEKRQYNLNHLKKVIKASALLDINLVTTFIGRDQFKTIEENIEEFKKEWPSIIDFASENNVKVAIENCPMLFDLGQWPGGQNMFTSVVIWRKLFEIIDSPYFGINFDPSHFIWQQMDYISPIYEFKDKMFHIHFKDIKILKDKLKEVGVLAYPLDYMLPKIPGLGDVNWSKFVSALTDIGYNGYACVEVEDRAFEKSLDDKLASLKLTKNYLNQFVI
ncbi:MAG: sugar phosphate isomerase/epimerase family protein [Pleomorphochaeta sp.]